MFTGLVAATGRLVSVRKVGQELDLTVDLGPVAEAADLGASIAISGVCCTVTARRGPNADFRLSKETLDRTWLGRAKVGQLVNLEAALRAGDPLGGHIVQGHVDGVGEGRGGLILYSLLVLRTELFLLLLLRICVSGFADFSYAYRDTFFPKYCGKTIP